MAADTRPFKSKEQDGQGNEVIIRDQQLVEQASQTTMASGEYFEIVDVDGRMAKIPKANMMSVVLEAIRLLLDDSGSNISAANLTKILGLSASSIGNILPADLASVLGGMITSLSSYKELIVPIGETRTVSVGANALMYYMVAGHNWDSGLFVLERTTIHFIKQGTTTMAVTSPSYGVIQFENKEGVQGVVHYFYIRIQ